MATDAVSSPKFTHFSIEEITMACTEVERLGMTGVMAHAHGAEGTITIINLGAALFSTLLSLLLTQTKA